VDSDPEPEFGRLTRLAQRLLDAPTTVVSLVGSGRQYFRSCAGMTGWPAEDRGTPLSYSFCKHGMDAHLAKPIDCDALGAVLTRWLPAPVPR